MEKFFHSVTLDSDLCKGCTNCVKRCPTEAIRVRDGKARIIKERCIDCGECIRVCPQHAKRAVVDPPDIINSFNYTVALPAPTLYAQFKDIAGPNELLNALVDIGFDDVFEVALAAEAVSAETARLMAEGGLERPVISTACPAVLRLIRVRFPELIPNILQLRSPMEVAARWAKRRAAARGIKPEQVGCVFITPCPAKVTAVRAPIGNSVSYVDAVVSMADLYPRLLSAIKREKESPAGRELSRAGYLGLGWAASGGESCGLGQVEYLAADGIENVIRVLEALEDDKISDVDFIELNACTGGCVGGVLTVENPFIAKARLKRLSEHRGQGEGYTDPPAKCELSWDEEMTYEPVMRLDEDITQAMRKLAMIRELEEQFNGMDCGACGAPSCRAMAEDIVQGYRTEDQCIYRMRQRLQELVDLVERKGDGRQ